MRKTLIIAAGLLMLSPVKAIGQIPDLSPERWRADIRFAAAAIPITHKDVFHHTSRAAFDAKIAELLEEAGSASDAEMVVGIQQLVASLGDGHSFLATWDLYRFYPLELEEMAGEMRVVRAGAGFEGTLGARVLAIDGIEIGEVRKRIRTVVPQGENEWYVRQQEAGQLIRAEVLQAMGVSSSVDHASFRLQLDGEPPAEVTLRSLAPKHKVDWKDVASPSFARSTDGGFWFRQLPGTKAAYLHFGGYDRMEENARSLFEFLDRTRPSALVIDMRWNGGGNFTLPQRFIIPQLKYRRWLTKPGRLYVLAGRRTFSAGMTNAIDFKRELGAILVGEPIGARPNGFQENGWLQLPNSKLGMSLSTMYYQFWPTDVDAVQPDVFVPSKWDDIRQGRDAALEHVIARLR